MTEDDNSTPTHQAEYSYLLPHLVYHSSHHLQLTSIMPTYLPYAYACVKLPVPAASVHFACLREETPATSYRVCHCQCSIDDPPYRCLYFSKKHCSFPLSLCRPPSPSCSLCTSSRDGKSSLNAPQASLSFQLMPSKQTTMLRQLRVLLVETRKERSCTASTWLTSS